MIGFPVVGIRCVINDGASHAVDSSEMAFKTAALMGFREAYAKSAPTILEPIMKVEIDAPIEFQGSVVGQVNQRRGSHSRDGRRGQRKRDLRSAAQHDVWVLDRPTFGDARQGNVHHGVCRSRHCPEAGAGGEMESRRRTARSSRPRLEREVTSPSCDSGGTVPRGEQANEALGDHSPPLVVLAPPPGARLTSPRRTHSSVPTASTRASCSRAGPREMLARALPAGQVKPAKPGHRPIRTVAPAGFVVRPLGDGRVPRGFHRGLFGGGRRCFWRRD